MSALGNAASDLQIQRLVVARIASDDVVDKFAPLRIRQRIPEPDAGQAVLQAFEVFGQPERVARIDRNHLIHAVAENEAAIEHRDACFFKRHEFAVEVNDICRHGCDVI